MQRLESVSGHGTDEMEELYSSVAPEVQRDGIAKVISLFGNSAARNSAGGPPLRAPTVLGGPERKTRPSTCWLVLEARRVHQQEDRVG